MDGKKENERIGSCDMCQSLRGKVSEDECKKCVEAGDIAMAKFNALSPEEQKRELD